MLAIKRFTVTIVLNLLFCVCKRETSEVEKERDRRKSCILLETLAVRVGGWVDRMRMGGSDMHLGGGGGAGPSCSIRS